VSVVISVSTTIDAAPAVTWAALEDIATHTRWMKDAVAIRFTGAQRTGTGTEFECVTRVGPFRLTDVMSVTAWEPGRTMGVDHRGAVRGSGRFSVHDAGGGRTAFAWDETLVFPWWLGGRLGERVARPVLTGIWRGNVARLKALVEGG
jgi:uncharacterized protein YndB with AHSA1/START domain